MKTTIMFLSILFICKTNYGQINQYTKPIENSTEKYKPVISDQVLVEGMKAQASAIKESIKEDINNYRQYYNAIPYFKTPKDGNYQTVAIVNNELKIEVNVSVINNRVTSINAKQTLNSSNGLKVTSDIKNGYSKVFQEFKGKMMIIEIYFPDLYMFDKPVNSFENSTSGDKLDISVFDKPDMATGNIIFSIPFKSRNEIKVTNNPEGDFYKIEFDGRAGYIYKTRFSNK